MKKFPCITKEKFDELFKIALAIGALEKGCRKREEVTNAELIKMIRDGKKISYRSKIPGHGFVKIGTKNLGNRKYRCEIKIVEVYFCNSYRETEYFYILDDNSKMAKQNIIAYII